MWQWEYILVFDLQYIPMDVLPIHRGNMFWRQNYVLNHSREFITKDGIDKNRMKYSGKFQIIFKKAKGTAKDIND